jgi:hypothetical protein
MRKLIQVMLGCLLLLIAAARVGQPQCDFNDCEGGWGSLIGTASSCNSSCGTCAVYYCCTMFFDNGQRLCMVKDCCEGA